jgi:hypothetical protein
VCAVLGTSPYRTDLAANLGLDPEGQMEEVFLLNSAMLLMYDNMRPRKKSDPAADPRSALKKLEAVRRIHRQRGITMVPMSNASLVLKGMLRRFIREHGVTSLVPDRKLPLTNVLIDGMLGAPETAPGATRGTLPPLSRSAYFWIAMLALFAVLAEVGARKDEVSGDHGKNGFSFASLTWKINGVFYAYYPGEALIMSMKEGDGVLFAHSVAKNDPFGAWFAATPSFLPWRATGRCACRLLIALERLAAVPANRRKATPLFGPSAGAFFTAGQVDSAFLLLLTAGCGLSLEACMAYSVHSFRIFVACALLQAGCPNWLIKRMLRWRGDASLEIYARVSDSEWSQWLDASLSSAVDASVVPRLPNLDFSPAQRAAFLEMANTMLGINAQTARAAAAPAIEG